VTRELVVTADQLTRAQPGGIGTYVRGLVRGLRAVAGENDLNVSLLWPRSPAEIETEQLFPSRRAILPEPLLTRVWRHVPLGVPRSADIVHATSPAGPFGGGRSWARHSITVHDVLWRDHPELTTPRGVAFHEERLRYVLSRHDIRIIIPSPTVAERLIADGVSESRITRVRLGFDPPPPRVMGRSEVLSSLGLTEVVGDEPFTLAVGTVEPRKNYERLIAAHAAARNEHPELGVLLIVGAAGWGSVDTTGALVRSEVDATQLHALRHHCRVGAFVPIDEGWGLPAVEMLAAGRPLVVSSSVPSVTGNEEVEVVRADNVEDIARGLVTALSRFDTSSDRDRRAASVKELTWEQCARDHLVAWQ